MKRTAISSRPSKAKRDFDAEYAAVLPSVLARDCEYDRYIAEDIHKRGPIVPYPNGWSLKCSGRLIGHHARGRDLKHPEVSNDPDNLRCLCDIHHRFVHAHGSWSREVGLMLSRIS